MDLKRLRDTPPWEWPAGTGKVLLDVLRTSPPSEADLLLATELAGDVTVIDDDLAAELLSIVGSDDRSAPVRGSAAIALGPVLEQMDADNPDDFPISERSFHAIQAALHRLYVDATVPQDVRRRILEAAVRAQQDWHTAAIRAAYATNDDAWKVTAVFCMRFIRGFDAQILESLESTSSDVHYEAVCAAGAWALDAAWPHVAALIASDETEKLLLLAAIEAAAGIRPRDAVELLEELAESDDEDVAEAVEEAIAIAESSWDDEDEEDDASR